MTWSVSDARAPGVAGTRTVDLRLAPAALGAWAAALLAVRVAPDVSLLVAGAAVVVAGAVTAAVVRRRWTAWAGEAGATAWALALLVGALVALPTAAQVQGRASGLLPRLVATGAAAEVTGRIVAPPQLVAPAWPGAPPRMRWALAAQRVREPPGAGAPGRAGRAVGDVVVLATTDRPGAADARGAGADVLEGPVFGSTVTVTGRLRPAERGAREVAVLLATETVVVQAPRAWDRAAERVRRGVRGLAAALPGDAGALLPGVTVGDTSRVGDDLRGALRTSGLTHLTAVSGAHFALVGALVLALGALLRAPPRAAATATAVAAVAMLVVVHPQPSVVRAAVMGAVGVLGLALGRPARAPAALSTAVVVLLVLDPWLAAELGFALSVAATAGLVLLGAALTRRWAPRLGRPAATALAAPVAAQLACGPLVLVAGGGVAGWGVVANLAAAPAVAPATLLGLAAAVVAPWWPQGAAVPAALAGAACWWIGAVARTAAGLPGAALPWLGGPLGVLTLTLAGLATARLLLHRPDDRGARELIARARGVRGAWHA